MSQKQTEEMPLCVAGCQGSYVGPQCQMGKGFQIGESQGMCLLKNKTLNTDQPVLSWLWAKHPAPTKNQLNTFMALGKAPSPNQESTGQSNHNTLWADLLLNQAGRSSLQQKEHLLKALMRLAKRACRIRPSAGRGLHDCRKFESLKGSEEPIPPENKDI